MTNPKNNNRGMSSIGLLIGLSLLSVAFLGAMKLLSLSLNAQKDLTSESLVEQINRIGELVTVHLNRGGSFKNPDVEAKGIQLCSLNNNIAQCNGYQPDSTNFCLSVPTRVSRLGRDVINLTGFRLHSGVLFQRELNDANMAQFDHAAFCRDNPAWRSLNNTSDFEFTAVRFCRFEANTPQQVTQDYEQNCRSVIQNTPESNMFWVALFKAKANNSLNAGGYEEARIIHLLNTTRVRIGS